MKPRVEFEFEKRSEYRCYFLPPEFWVAYLELRNWLLRHPPFFGRVYRLDHLSDRLACAWAVLDAHFDAIYLKEIEDRER